MTKLIIRIRFQYHKNQLESGLNQFFQYTYQSILYQTASDFICFIHYAPEIEDEFLKAVRSRNLQDSRFIFYPSTRKDTVYQYLSTVDFSQVEEMRFLELSSFQIFPSDMLSKVRDITYITPILLLNNRYLYQSLTDTFYLDVRETNSSYVYACTKVEYLRLFRVYDYIHNTHLKKVYLQLPHTLLPLDLVTVGHTFNSNILIHPVAPSDETKLHADYIYPLHERRLQP